MSPASKKSPYLRCAGQALPPSCFQLFSFSTQPGGRGKRNSELSAQKHIHISRPLLLLYGSFPLQLFPPSPEGRGSQGRQLWPFCRKGHLLLARQLRDDAWPPEEGRYHLLCVAFAQRFGAQLCKCKTIGGYPSSPVNPSEAKRVMSVHTIQVASSVQLTAGDRAQSL